MRTAAPLIISGPRQSGKTTALLALAAADPFSIVLEPFNELAQHTISAAISLYPDNDLHSRVFSSFGRGNFRARGYLRAYVDEYDHHNRKALEDATYGLEIVAITRTT